MRKIKQWQDKHCISNEAMFELSEMLGLSIPRYMIDPNLNMNNKPQSEAAVQVDCRLKASSIGGRLWRNNVGVAFREDGTPIRYGLCNETKKMNQIIKSSDLIGILPITITPVHIGMVIGQFWAPEIKEGNWKFTGTPREVAQLKFQEMVNDLGGVSKFVNNVEQL